jgi:hypothetical protein
MNRKVHRDNRGLYLSAGGWIIRPQHPDSAYHEGDTVKITTDDPVSLAFGIVCDESHVERWRIYNSETAENRGNVTPRAW